MKKVLADFLHPQKSKRHGAHRSIAKQRGCGQRKGPALGRAHSSLVRIEIGCALSPAK
jgi:hypothetical protein